MPWLFEGADHLLLVRAKTANRVQLKVQCSILGANASLSGLVATTGEGEQCSTTVTKSFQLYLCVLLASLSNNSFYSHGSTWPSLVKRRPTFLSQPRSCEIGQGIKKWVGGPGQNDGLEEREWENRLIRSPKLLEDVWEREGWKGWRLKGFERVRDECQSFYTGKDLSFLTLQVHGTPAASRPLSLILLTPRYAQHSSDSEEGTMERLDIMLSFMGFLYT